MQIDLCVVSRFPRAQETARIALGDARAADVPRVVDGDLDDIRLGELEGRTLADYRSWKRGRSRDEPFPGGESLNDAARRYADAYERILRRDEETVLCICHEIPVRYAINMASGSRGVRCAAARREERNAVRVRLSGLAARGRAPARL